MKPGAGKQKGAEFERWVCKKLSLWVSGDERDDLFWRSAMSGGRATIGVKDRPAQAGDISSIDQHGHDLIKRFVIECKFHKSIDLQQAIFGKGILIKWWNDLDKLSDKLDKSPMLIAKQNHIPPIVLFRVQQSYTISKSDMLCTLYEGIEWDVNVLKLSNLLNIYWRFTK